VGFSASRVLATFVEVAVTITAPVGRDYPAQIATGALAVLSQVFDASMTEIAFLLLTGGSDNIHEVLGAWCT